MSFKLVNYQCPQCGGIQEDFAGELVECDECLGDTFTDSGTIENATWTNLKFRGRGMLQIFSPKNNSQRARVND